MTDKANTAPVNRSGKLRRAGQFVGTLAVGHSFIQLEEYAFDYLLYPFMLYQGGEWLIALGARVAGTEVAVNAPAGYWLGFGVMCALSVAVNLAYLRFYDFSQTDWFGIE